MNRPTRLAESGFSTVEVVFAVVIMTVGLLGLAGSTAHTLGAADDYTVCTRVATRCLLNPVGRVE